MVLDDLNRYYVLLNFMMEQNDQEGIDAVINDISQDGGFVYLRQLAYRIECNAQTIDLADDFDLLAVERDIHEKRRTALLRQALRRYQVAEKLWRRVGLAGTPGAVRCLEGQIRILEQQGDRKTAAALYDALCKELSKYSSQYQAVAGRLNECVEMLIDDQAWSEAEKVAKTAYVASIQAWRSASHPFTQISLQNLHYVLKKLGKESIAARVRDFSEKKKNEGTADEQSHCGCCTQEGRRQ